MDSNIKIILKIYNFVNNLLYFNIKKYVHYNRITIIWTNYVFFYFVVLQLRKSRMRDI